MEQGGPGSARVACSGPVGNTTSGRLAGFAGLPRTQGLPHLDHSDRARSTETTQGAAVDDPIRALVRSRSGFPAGDRNAAALFLRQTDWQLSGIDPQRGFQQKAQQRVALFAYVSQSSTDRATWCKPPRLPSYTMWIGDVSSCTSPCGASAASPRSRWRGNSPLASTG